MGKHIDYTAELKSEIWDRYKNGDSIRSIGRFIDRPSSSIYKQLAPTGGIRPVPRTRPKIALSIEDREEISRGIVANLSIREIASQLSRSPSTISREVNKNGGRRYYRAAKADKIAWSNALRPKLCKLAIYPQLALIVEKKLRLKWSPEQVAGWLKKTYPNDDSMKVSHETIYKSLFIQARGVLKKELLQLLRSKRVIRRSKSTSLKGDGLGRIPNAVSIRERPAEVEDRAVPGHWEGDLIEGSQYSCIATLVERHTRFVVLVKVPSKKNEEFINALIKQAQKLPRELYKSLTWDRGTEMKAHQKFTLATDIQVYFCDPRSPWQRGSNENTNRLLRQYLPKGTDLFAHSQEELDEIARQLNTRPRKTLGYDTPADRFNECVATIH
jgi:IS30 family transposase